MSAELIIGQEKMYITPNTAIKWAWGMIISLVVPYAFNMLACFYHWKIYTVPLYLNGIENVYSSTPWNLYYIVIGILFCAIRYRKTITLRPNISKRTSQYMMMFFVNTFVFVFLLLFYTVFIHSTIVSYMEHIARVGRYTQLDLDLLYAMLPSFGGYYLLKTWLAYQATRFLFDKGIRTN